MLDYTYVSPLLNEARTSEGVSSNLISSELRDELNWSNCTGPRVFVSPAVRAVFDTWSAVRVSGGGGSSSLWGVRWTGFVRKLSISTTPILQCV